MQTNFSPEFLATSSGARANEILRKCVHCGFCNATCPTYQITGDELDGPRGRIYLIRELLETGANEARAIRHLDRCLTCRACETTCPSGVDYGELAELARNEIGPGRGGVQGAARALLRWMVPRPRRLRFMARLGRPFRFLLPRPLAKQVPAVVGQVARPQAAHERRVVLLNGCAQQVATAATNAALVRLLEARGIGVAFLPDEACCGALDLHLGAEDAALQGMKRNVEQLHAMLDQAEAIVSSASGCGVTVKDYGRLLAHDPEFAERAAAVSARTRDAAEFLTELGVGFDKLDHVERVAWHPPCTLQHGQRITGVVERILERAGYTLVDVVDRHICCGSAGTYSILQPALGEELRSRKLAALSAEQPDVIATANVGCQTHLGYESEIPVMHWVELLR